MKAKVNSTTDDDGVDLASQLQDAQMQTTAVDLLAVASVNITIEEYTPSI